jgi:hypothetical protein
MRLLLLLALLPAHTLACEPLLSVGLGYSEDYASTIIERSGQQGMALIPGFLGTVKGGVDCKRINLYIQHTSSIDSGRDYGHNAIVLEFNIFGD